MASIRDIARSAKVSTGTVSRVLNSQPNVSLAAREKVLKATNLLRGNQSSGTLRTATSIALVYRGQSSLYSRFDASLLHAIVGELGHTHHDLVLINASRSRLAGESLGQMLVRRKVAGALLRTTSMTRSMCEELGLDGFPTVAIADRIDHQNVGCVYCDTDLAVRRGLEHLYHLGHRKIAIGMNLVEDHDHVRRFDAFRKFISDHDLPLDERWIIRSAADQTSGGAILRQIMTLPDRPTAIFLTDPAVGAGLCIEALRSGIRIPGDLSVVGFDDTEDRFSTHPRLSSVVQDAGMLGRRATQLLLDIIDRRTDPGLVRLEGCFEPLDSTSPPTSLEESG